MAERKKQEEERKKQEETKRQQEDARHQQEYQNQRYQNQRDYKKQGTIFQSRFPDELMHLRALDINIDIPCGLDEIKNAWKIKAKQHHPDKGGNPEIFKVVRLAYETLMGSMN